MKTTIDLADRPAWQSSRRIIQRFWAIAGPYWKGEDRWIGAALLTLALGGVLGRVITVVALNSTNGAFFNSLQNKDSSAFYRNSLFVGVLLLGQLVMVVMSTFCSQMLQIRWRKWLTAALVGQWLADASFYKMRFHRPIDNPDQRISDDLRLLVADTLTLGMGFLDTVLNIAAFSGVLYALSGSIQVAGTRFAISGYLFWSALLYWGTAAAIGYTIGNPLIWLNNRQQNFEADFRFALVRVREKAEAIAVYDGERAESSRLRKIYSFVNLNSIRLLLRGTKLLAFQTFMIDASSPLSFVLCAPRFFAGIIPLGDIMRAANGFYQLSQSMSWLVSAYPVFADWHATLDRLHALRQDFEDTKHESVAMRRSDSANGSIELRDVTAKRPDGTNLFKPLTTRLVEGEDVLVQGPSGAGKSTLLRMLAGIWPFCTGWLSSPPRSKTLMLPQQPFLPIDSLRAAAWYPHPEDGNRDAEVISVLRAVGLEHLTPRLDDEAHWEQILSIGEQQRLAIAQAILARPAWLFLDEATSALDPAQEQAIYLALKKLLRSTTIVSVGHRIALESLHGRTISIRAAA
jgi:vitamin B12/bleomycin/antimicrobial peptide transport system ATP-binding/permease protein